MAKTFVLVTKEPCVGDNGKKSKSTLIPQKLDWEKYIIFEQLWHTKKLPGDWVGSYFNAMVGIKSIEWKGIKEKQKIQIGDYFLS